MNKILITAAAAVTATMLGLVVFAPSFVAADEHGGSAQKWNDKSAEDMGKHSMGGTVESIDHKTGWLKLKTGLGELTLHYPPPAIKELKKGDKITANLSYTKDEAKRDDGMMKMK